MSAITAFSEADTLRFQTLAYTLDGPSQVAGAKSNQPGCVTKNAGELGFKLSARDDLHLYSIAEIKVSFDGDPGEEYYNPDIILNLVPMGSAFPVANGRMRQPFTVDEKPGVNIRYTGYDVHVDSIQGHICLDLVERDPWAETTGCMNEPRYVRADIEAVPGESSLEIKGSVAGNDATLHATWFALAGTAASPGFDVGIGVHRTECGIVGVVPGGQQHFWASVGNVPSGARTYSWTVKGGTIIGKPNLPWIDVQLSNVSDPDPAPVHVEMRVEIAGLSALAAIDFHPDTPQESYSKELRCRVQGYLHHNFHENPLWDPLRDYVARPFTRAELVRLRDVATQLLRGTEQLLEHERE